MKKFSSALTILSAALFGCANGIAQPYTPFTASQDVDIANIRARALVHGDMWWDPAISVAKCEFPKGSGKSVGFAAAPWMAGYDPQGNLKVSAGTYRQSGMDYWPGPVDVTSTTMSQRYTKSATWARIWKVATTDIQTFKNNTTHTATNTPTDIWEWPANGNTHAKGAGTSMLTISQPMAPFVDVNHDGIYDAASGDYPAIKGDQMLWWIINDVGPQRDSTTKTNSKYMEIAISAYAYNSSTVLKNIVFYEYAITNRNTNGFGRERFGLLADMDLYYGFDDYIGYDSSRRLGIVYNGSNAPATDVAAAGVVLLETPGDSLNHYQPAGSFVTFTNGSLTNGDPRDALAYNYLLNSRNSNGTSPSNSNGSAYGPYVVTDYECTNNNTPGDRRFVLAGANFGIGSGQTVKMAFALVAADSTGNCPNEHFSALQATSDTAMKWYWNLPASWPTAIASAPKNSALSIYPNPTNNTLFVALPDGIVGSARIYNALGAELGLPQNFSGNKLSITTSSLPTGMYTLRIAVKEGMRSAIFIKK